MCFFSLMYAQINAYGGNPLLLFEVLKVYGYHDPQTLLDIDFRWNGLMTLEGAKVTTSRWSLLRSWFSLFMIVDILQS